MFTILEYNKLHSPGLQVAVSYYQQTLFSNFGGFSEGPQFLQDCDDERHVNNFTSKP
jgi:hypothetical protein